MTSSSPSSSPSSSSAPAGSIEAIPCLSDNYSWLVHAPSSSSSAVTIVVDPGEAEPVRRRLSQRGYALTHVLITHHHWDHVGGAVELARETGAEIWGPEADRERIPGIVRGLKDGETVSLGSDGALAFTTLHTPGHTRGHATYYFPALAAAFTGDTLFSLGCGRLFEGTPHQMRASLAKIAALPPTTRVYCGHEYTQSNARFAKHVDANNANLRAFAKHVDALRARDLPTVPSLLTDELECNPFYRYDDPNVRKAVGVDTEASEDQAFAAVRSAKDHF